MTKAIAMAVCLVLTVAPAYANPLPDYTFKSPSFNGNGYSSHVLTIQNEEYTRQQAIDQALQAAAQQAQTNTNNTPVNQFLSNLESRIYAQISQNLATAMFAPGAATSGSLNFQGNTIFWQNLGSSINLQVTDTVGNQTTINVPLGQFTFMGGGN
jgi:Type VIII secretion system (T8SS), CsgF protein